LKVRFVTNETQDSKASLVTKLQRMGFELTEDEVVAPCPAMVHELKAKGLRPHLLVHPSVLSISIALNYLFSVQTNCLFVHRSSVNSAV
jgi:ribonucleotide monophosphatase NagD (HAD superfamily)